MPAIEGSVSLDGTITAYTTAVTAAGVPGWELVDCGLAAIGRRRDVVTSPWVHEDIEVASVRAALSYRVVLRAVAATLGEASGMVDDAIAVAEQTEWQLVVDLDGHTETYSCRAASQIEMPYDRAMVLNGRRELTITIPVRKAA
jgi:hypothetical protein